MTVQICICFFLVAFLLFVLLFILSDYHSLITFFIYNSFLASPSFKCLFITFSTDQHFGLKVMELRIFLLSLALSVSLWQKFSYFPPLDFSDFLHQVSLLETILSDKARFSKKKIPGPKLGKMGPKWPKFWVFRHFLDFESFLWFWI